MHEDEFSSKPHLFHRWTETQSIQNCEIPPTPLEQWLFQYSLESMLPIFVSSVISFHCGGGSVGMVLYHSFQWVA